MADIGSEMVGKEFLNIHDLSQFLGIKVSTLYAMVEEKRVPHYRIGRLIRFRRSEIDRWLEPRREECVDINRAARRILKAIERPSLGIDRIVRKAVDEAKPGRYNLPHGKPDQVKGLGKEVPDGTI